MEEENKPDYNKYTLYDLHDVYFIINRENFPDRFLALKNEISNRFNLASPDLITDEFMINQFSKYGSDYLKLMHSENKCFIDNSENINPKDINTADNIDSDKLNDLLFPNKINEEVLDNLASRFDRLCASIIDGVIWVIPIFMMGALAGFQNFFSWVQKSTPLESSGVFAAQEAIYLLLNIWLLIHNGQTIGKNLIGIKMVTKKGKIPLLKYSYLARHLVIYLILSHYSLLINNIFLIIDSLFIFGNDKRCLHDFMARTLVVNEE